MKSIPQERPHREFLDMDEENWKQLRSSLQLQARHFISTMNIPAWHGQEDDLAEDIVQETIERTIVRIQKAETGQMAPVYAFKGMMKVIASNYCKDVRRHDKRLLYMGIENKPLYTYHFRDVAIDCASTAVEDVYQKDIFNRIAQAVITFPLKQRNALLIDLANRMSFNEKSTPLQKAFFEVGIDLKEYRQRLPEDPLARGRHTALLHYAYKRLTTIAEAWKADDEEISA